MSTINGVLVTRINPTNLYLEIEDKTRSSLPMTFVGAHTKTFPPHTKASQNTKEKYRRDIKHERKSSFFLVLNILCHLR